MRSTAATKPRSSCPSHGVLKVYVLYAELIKPRVEGLQVKE